MREPGKREQKYEPVFTNAFEKDVARMLARGKDKEKLKELVEILLSGERPLDKKYKDHPLPADTMKRRDCHIEGDWLVLYKIIDMTVVFYRTGTHRDLFKGY